MSPPSVSVAMPVHNGMPFLEESISSILAQTFTNFELVIGDDGSDDGSNTLLLSLAAKDSRIRLLRRERRSGLAASANWVIRETHAPVVAIAHADDRSAPDRLRRQMEIFALKPDTVLVGALSDSIDEKGRVVRPPDFWRVTHRSPFAPFAHSSVMFRRDAFEAIGGYRSAAEYWEDLDLYLRMAEHGRLYVVPEKLASIRHTENSTRLRDEPDLVDEAVDLMYRAVNAYRCNGDYERVIRIGAVSERKLWPRTFIGRGSTRIWMGRPPDVLRRLWRRGLLEPDAATLQALVWATWGEISPRTLRLFMLSILRLRNRSARRRLVGRSSVEWRPWPEIVP